jgi:O-antigen ligase/polysaccharide polymerase Wzy-like membrane protein
MVSSPLLPRLLLIYGISIPLAVFVGYFLATPLDLVPFFIFTLLVMLLVVPLFLRWYHPILIFSWNAALIFILLPGQPFLWVPMAGTAFLFALLDRILSKRETFQNVPSVTWPLVLLAIVMLLTAKATGGIGLRSLGSETYGGKRYMFMLAAIVGYFALIGKRVPIHLAPKYSAVFFLSSLTAMVSNLIFAAGPALYFLYYVFPVDYAIQQAGASLAVGGSPLVRLTGLTASCIGVFCFMLFRYGIQGWLDFSKPWRLLIVLAAAFSSLFGGFRSSVIVLGLVLVFQFFFEGLHRTKYLPIFGLTAVLILSALLPFASALPGTVQRSLSIIPFIQIDTAARENAEATLDWRYRMWSILRPEVPKYLWLGKGFAINSIDMYLTEEGIKRGIREDVETSIISGNYHNGPLSLLIAFGIPGTLAFVLFILGATRVLYRNYRDGPAALRSINTFLLSYFLARTVFFFGFYGDIAGDLFVFTGIIGLGMCLNGGMQKRAPAEEELQPQLVPAGQAA